MRRVVTVDYKRARGQSITCWVKADRDRRRCGLSRLKCKRYSRLSGYRERTAWISNRFYLQWLPAIVNQRQILGRRNVLGCCRETERRSNRIDLLQAKAWSRR